MSGAPGIDLEHLQSRILGPLGAPRDTPWYVAYSGGLDSTVLLHILARICGDAGISLTALHADHGLHPRSEQWRGQCKARCRAWRIGFRSTRLVLDGGDGRGTEGRARDARYQWFRETAGPGAWLFTAHHRGDQAETVIERLSRGAGPRGLRGILPRTDLYGLRVVRPLLAVRRASIEAYAHQHGLCWVTDDSNRDAYFTRNYIRHHVVPVLAERWPGIETALARTAQVMADTQRILEEAAHTDLAALDNRRVRGDPSLDVPSLRAATPERRRNVLSEWIRRETGTSIGFARLNRLDRAIVGGPDAPAGLRWPPLDLRLFQNRLYLVRHRAPPGTDTAWRLQEDLRFENQLVLRARAVVGHGLKRTAVAGGVGVTFRRGGEKCRLPGRRHHHTLKNILHAAGVPPWQRPRMPLVTVRGDIAAIPGLTCCDPYAAGPDEPGIDIEAIYT